jgi:hypothetical protein
MGCKCTPVPLRPAFYEMKPCRPPAGLARNNLRGGVTDALAQYGFKQDEVAN